MHPDNVGGLAFEREETRVNGVLTRNESRHYISVGGSVVAVVKTLNDASTLPTNVSQTVYWHKDALGSIVAVSNRSGQVLERMAFDPWGRRLRELGRPDPLLDPLHGDRGFTGHEHLDELALVHMNGRVYDPLLGRFLSPDPIIADANELQTYNRYSYVFNRPLVLTDPSGNCPICAVAFIVGTIMASEGNKYWSIVGRVMQMWGGAAMLGGGVTFEGGLSALGGAGAGLPAEAASFLSAFGSGMVNGDGFEQSLISGAFAGTFTIVGAEFAGNLPKLVAMHALVGCAQGAVSGGKCGPSALAAGFGKLATVNLEKFLPNPVLLGIATTVAGGTASVIGGGKFANGALQAGFGYLFNHVASDDSRNQGAKLAEPKPEHIEALEKLRALAIEATREVDANCTGFCKLPWIRGTKIHTVFAEKVRAVEGFDAEVSYLNRVPVRYGLTGSIRADAIFGDRAKPAFAVDLKTGFFGYMSTGEANAYFKNLPRGTELYRLKVE